MKHEFSALRKKCNLVLDKTNGRFDDLVMTAVDRKYFDAHVSDFITYKKTAAIWEGEKYCIVCYYQL